MPAVPVVSSQAYPITRFARMMSCPPEVLNTVKPRGAVMPMRTSLTTPAVSWVLSVSFVSSAATVLEFRKSPKPGIPS